MFFFFTFEEKTIFTKKLPVVNRCWLNFLISLLKHLSFMYVLNMCKECDIAHSGIEVCFILMNCSFMNIE